MFKLTSQLSHQPDPQFPNSSEHTRYTALHIAAGLGHTETARALLDHPLIDLNIAVSESFKLLLSHVFCLHEAGTSRIAGQ